MNERERQQVVFEVIGLLVTASGKTVAEITDWYEEHGLHHQLLDIVDPEAADFENPDYSATLDEFENNLIEVIEQRAE